MSVHIWAAEKGITEVNVVGADECDLNDMGIIESNDGTDPYIDAFNDLLNANGTRNDLTLRVFNYQFYSATLRQFQVRMHIWILAPYIYENPLLEGTWSLT